MKKSIPLVILQIFTLIIVLIGAIGSLRLMFYVGRYNNSVLLMSLFAVWVASPFVGLIVANIFSKNWSTLQRLALYALMIILTIISLGVYIGLFSPPKMKPTTIFLLLPLISWLLIVTFLLITKKIPRKSNV